MMPCRDEMVMFDVKEVVMIGPTLMVTMKLKVELQRCVAQDKE